MKSEITESPTPPSFNYEEFQKRISSITDIKARQLALLEDTMQAYTLYTRAKDFNGCVYFPTEHSVGCAIGRCLPRNSELLSIEWQENARRYDQNTGIQYVLDKCPLWIQEMNNEFLTQLQALHDSSVCWNEFGLSDAGKLQANRIKTKYCV